MCPYSRITVHSISLDRLATIQLDFDKIESACGLTFNDELRLDLKNAIAEYQDAKVRYEKIPAEEVKRYLGKVIHAIEILSPVLDISNPTVAPEINLEPVLQAVWKHSRPYKSHHPEEHVIKRYLEDWRDLALEAKKLKGSRGKPLNIALRTFLCYYLYPAFLKAGGAGRGCFVDREDGKYTGPLYALALEILNQVDPKKVRPANLGQVIMSVIPSA